MLSSLAQRFIIASLAKLSEIDHGHEFYFDHSSPMISVDGVFGNDKIHRNIPGLGFHE